MTPRNSKDAMHIELDPGAAAAIQRLKTVDFELAYLALLTREGLKPLSRWEKALDEPNRQALGQFGLLTREVHRKVRTGQAFTETIFGKMPGYINIYAEHFDGRPVDKSAETVRIEGFLFGYPPCCIAQYIKHPYAPNEFPGHKREILFHWSCQGCLITPLLIPLYERLHHLLRQC